MRGDGRVYQRGSRFWIQYSVRGKQFREPGGKTEAASLKKLKARLREALGEQFIGPNAERVTVAELLDGLLVHSKNKGLRSAKKIESHAKAVRAFFSLWRAVEITTLAVEKYQASRIAAGKRPATVNRELEVLRRAFNHAAKHTPPRLPRHMVPSIPLLLVDNVRTGYFERADIEALLKCVPDTDVKDVIEWGFRTGMRKGEIGKLTWDMLDRSASPWVLYTSAGISKNKTGRALGLEGEVRAIIERRIKARRLECPFIFHRSSKGRVGQQVKDFSRMWRNALRDAKLPAGRLFHDLRRSAVRTLIRSGVDPSIAMKVSGHKTRSMLDRYNIISEAETAAAFSRADAYLSTQPSIRNVEEGQFGDSRVAAGAEVLTSQQRLAEAGRNRTYRPWC